jgi:hypothetical protein
MRSATIRASLQVSLWDAMPAFAASPWSMAALYDAYCGFLTFYVWFFYKERSRTARVLWFVAIMTLGNFAMSVYVLIQLFRLKSEEPAEAMLWRWA